MAKKFRFTEEQLAQIEARYKSGETPKNIAVDYNCSRDVIRTCLIQRKVTLRTPSKNKNCIICDSPLNQENTTWYRQKNYIHKCNDCIKSEKAIDAVERRSRDPKLALQRTYLFRKKLQKQNPKRYTAQQMRGSAKKRAAALGVKYDLDSAYIEAIMPDICPVLRIPIKYGGGEKSIYSASLDRIYPDRGYVKGNVLVMSQLANLMKNEANPTHLIAFSKWVQATYKENPSGDLVPRFET